ncbi:hypothetical protein A3726_27845 [Erythrobacter sp. HI0037]|nr:hypothetical protein A3726_27845 [Erythrobacter sp. HI0037]
MSLMLSMRTMFDPAKAAAMSATIGFDIAGERFLARLADGELPIERGGIDAARAIIRAPAAPVVAGLLYAGVAVGALEAEGGLVIEGDRNLALAFVDLFELPPPLA